MLAKRFKIPLMERPMIISESPMVANRNPTVPSSSSMISNANIAIPNAIIMIRSTIHFIIKIPFQYYSCSLYSLRRQ